MINRVIDFVRSCEGKILDSPRKNFFSSTAKRFSISFNTSKNRFVFDFKGGSILEIEKWRVVEAIEFLERQDEAVMIGSSISEDTPLSSLEGYLKDKAKKRYGRKTDTKTAPHIADLLVITGIAELDYTTSPYNRKVQGIKLKQV